MTIQEAAEKFKTSPEFAALSYEEQVQLKAKVLPDILKNDATFLGLNPTDRSALFQKLVTGAPTLEDKDMESQMHQLVLGSQSQDPRIKKQSQDAITVAITNQYITGASLLAKVGGWTTAQLEKLAPGAFPYAKVDALMTKNPKDLIKMTQYFESQVDPNSGSQRTINAVKTVAPIIGNLLDWSAIGGIVGGTQGAGTGLGRLAMSASVKAAERAGADITGKFMASLGKSVSHAVLTGAIGTAREQTLDILRKGEVDPNVQNILVNNAKWFAGYFLGDSLFNFVLDTVAPTLYGMKQIMFPKGQVKRALRGITDLEKENIILDVLGAREIPQTSVEMSGSAKETLRTLQATVRVMQNVGNPAREDVIAMALARHQYNLVPLEGGGYNIKTLIKELDPKGVLAKVKFDNLDAVSSWFMQTPDALKKNATGPASMTWKQFKEANPGVVDRGVHRGMVEASLGKGEVVPATVMQEYPDLLPLHLRPMQSMEAAAGAYHAELNEVVRGKVKDPTKVDVMVRLFAPEEGKPFEQGRLQAFARHYGASVGVKKAELDQIHVISTPSQGKVMREDLKFVTPKEIYIIPKATLKGAEKDALSNITRMIGDMVGGDLQKGAKAAGKKLTNQYGASILNQKLFTSQWAQEAASDLNLVLKQEGQPKLWSIYSDKGELLKQGTFDDMKLELVKRSVDPDYFKAYLSQQGFTLKQTKDLEYQVLRPGHDEPYITGPTVQAILDQAPELMPKIPSKLGPELAVVVPGKRVDVKYQNGLAVGGYDHLMQTLDTYSSADLLNQKVSLHVGNKGYIYSHRMSKQLEVYIPEVGYRRYFDKLDEAQAYVKGGWEQITELKKIAMKKGYILQPEGGHYLLWSEGISIKAKSLDEVKAVLRDVPIPEWAPELSGLTEEFLVGAVKPPEGQFLPLLRPDAWAAPSKGSVNLVARVMDTPGMVMEAMVRKGGDEKLLKAYHQVQTNRGIVRGMDHESTQLAYTVASPGGKLLKEDRLDLIGEYIDASKEGKAELSTMLSGDEMKVAEGFQRLYAGLKTKFGVDPKMARENYFPHLSKHRLANPGVQYGEGDVQKMLRDAFGPKPPAELDAFFKHWRYSDVMSVVNEKNALKAFIKYSQVGNRQLVMGPVWKDAMQALRETTDEEMALHFQAYLNDVQGLPQGTFAVMMRQAAKEDLGRVGVSGSHAEQIIDKVMSMGYVAALGFNPWKAIRNVLDMYVTVAPRLGWEGTEVISQAFRDIIADKKGLLFNRARASGVLSGLQKTPLGESFATEGVFGKIADSGMAWYKNGDELTRVAAYRASEIKWERAQAIYEAGITGKGPVMTEDAFTEMSGLATMAPTKQNEIRAYIHEGKWTTGKAAFAFKLVEETLFPNMAGMSPMMFRGTVGKIFGMMGHYPVYYVENIRRALRHGTPATKAAFIGVFLANSAALVATTKLLGTNGQDFQPWNPMQFTGGPFYQMMNTAMMSLGRGYQGRQARAELFGISTDQEAELGFKIDITKSTMARWFIPGGFQLLKMQKALDYFAAGDDQAAWLSMAGATADPVEENRWLSRLGSGGLGATVGGGG